MDKQTKFKNPLGAELVERNKRTERKFNLVRVLALIALVSIFVILAGCQTHKEESKPSLSSQCEVAFMSLSDAMEKNCGFSEVEVI